MGEGTATAKRRLRGASQGIGKRVCAEALHTPSASPSCSRHPLLRRRYRPPVPEQSPADTAGARRLVLSEANKPRTGDFDALLERRLIRVLVPYSRSLYFVDRGRERGITAGLARDFERHLNGKYAEQLGKRPLTVLLIVTTRDRLFPDLAAGLGDIAAGNLTTSTTSHTA